MIADKQTQTWPPLEPMRGSSAVATLLPSPKWLYG
jgi:hypothetical protein